jgi:hypothetical protein
MVIFENFRFAAAPEEEDPHEGQLPLKEEPAAHISSNNAFISDVTCSFFAIKGKGKAVPLQAWSGPEDSRKLRFPDFMTTA